MVTDTALSQPGQSHSLVLTPLFSQSKAFLRVPEIEVKTDLPVWYCARTKPKQEQLAAANVRVSLGLTVFLPRLRCERMTRRGKVRSTEPLFPGYIFVYTGFNTKFEEIRRTFGVSSLVHFGDVVPTVPDSAIEELKKHFESDEPVVVREEIRPGAEVSVGSGAFADLNGVVLKTLPARKRVQVLLEILGRTTVVEMDHNSLVCERSSIVTLIPALAACL